MPGDVHEARATLVAFQRRAERIMTTSAAQREDLATIGSTLKVLVRVGQAHQDFQRTHLPEEELVHAAAIIRPVTLQKESVDLGRVVNAISLLMQEAPKPLPQYVRTVQKAWSKILTSERWEMMAADAAGTGHTRLTDVEIAELWFNAHIWHDDQDKQRALRLIPESECLISASVWVSDRVLLVRAFQQLITDLRQMGHLRV